MHGYCQRIEIRHGAKQRIDAGVIGNVVTEIRHRRRENRRQPNRIDAERFQIRQARNDPVDIADAVAVGVLKRARIDLIENAVSPPVHVALIRPGICP